MSGPTSKEKDEKHLQRALELARAGIGLCSPNPYVGAVIVASDGSIVGEGSYSYTATRHAEIIALQEAGARARDATLYINLEPHAHQGRTPPCTDALIEAGIERVVAAMPDPNPKVSGRGFEQLRKAGVQVQVGGLDSQVEVQARKLNEAFARYVRGGTPLVTLKAAMTLDGKIAPAPAQAVTRDGIPPGGWVTSEIARAHVQELRHAHDALMVGVGTILADNPMLTDRSDRPRRRPLLRVILDSSLRLPADSRLVQDAATRRTNDVIVFCVAAEETKRLALENFGVRVQLVPAFEDSGKPDLSAVLQHLGKLEIASVMIEGGATVNWTALARGVVDKIFFYYAPKILAGSGSIPFAAGVGFRHMSQAAQVKEISVRRFGEDFAVEGYLRDPYKD